MVKKKAPAPLPRRFLSKIKTPQALRRLLAAERKARRTVVFTNGCFDLLHKGHVSYLEQARRLGHRLVVALNSDESVRRIKGPERPLNKLEDRLDVMAALEAVDYVTWFEEDTPQVLVRALRPDVLVKGGDWKAADLPETPDVLSWGGKVKILPYVQGRSTTKIIERARLRKKSRRKSSD